MIKFKLSFFVFISLFSATCLSQDVTKAKEVKNILSIAAGGTSTTLGISYERILSSRKVSLEIGTGLLLGGGLGMNFYLFKPINKGQFNPFLGVRSSHNIQGSGGSRVVI